MAHQKIKYTLIGLLLIFIFSESCSTNSRGIFEKRKHLKGWHFHKKTSISQKSSNDPRDIAFKKKNDVLNVRNQTSYSTSIDKLEVRKSKIVNTNTVKKELVGFRSTSNVKFDKKAENKRINHSSQPELNKADQKSFQNSKKSHRGWSLNAMPDGRQGAYFFLFMLAPFLFKNGKRKQVQAWAARNKTKSRTLLVVAKVLLAATSIGLGFMVGAPFSLPLLLLSVGLLILSIGLSEYWNRNGKMTQKKNLGILGVVNTSTSFGFFSLGGMLANGFQFSEWSLNSGLLNFSSNNPDNELVYHPVYIITAILLMTFFLAALLALVGWLSCNVYCGTSETLGIIIFAIGYFVFIFGYVYLIQKLFVRENDSGDSRKSKIALIISSIITVLLTLFISVFGFA